MKNLFEDFFAKSQRGLFPRVRETFEQDLCHRAYKKNLIIINRYNNPGWLRRSKKWNRHIFDGIEDDLNR